MTIVFWCVRDQLSKRNVLILIQRIPPSSTFGHCEYINLDLRLFNHHDPSVCLFVCLSVSGYYWDRFRERKWVGHIYIYNAHVHCFSPWHGDSEVRTGWILLNSTFFFFLLWMIVPLALYIYLYNSTPLICFFHPWVLYTSYPSMLIISPIFSALQLMQLPWLTLPLWSMSTGILISRYSDY